MREVKDQKWYKKMKGEKSHVEHRSMEHRSDEHYPTTDAVPQQMELSIMNEADKSLKKMKEKPMDYGCSI